MPPRPNFQDKWLADDQFKEWLGRVAGCSAKAYCHVCHKQLSAEIMSLKRHRLSKQHVSLMTRRLPEGRRDPEQGASASNEDRELPDAVAYATVLFLVFIAKHNLPFSLCDDMITLQKRMFPDSAIAAALALKRKKCTALLQDLGDYVGNR
ncbi:uncharacterized protein LOC143027446 [Oratosquilla oratoria]|uniref:uncharacterized protein LOC143027446 n=1 Tax=Oratosquilla oratoria TaxID=337810 RepID=UPI003F76894F